MYMLFVQEFIHTCMDMSNNYPRLKMAVSKVDNDVISQNSIT